MEAFNKLLTQINDWVWGIPLIVLILAVGFLLTVRTGLIQVKHLGKALRFMLKDEEDGEGDVTSFGALCTALSATIGTGNIVGVATADCSRRSRSFVLDGICGISRNGNKICRGSACG